MMHFRSKNDSQRAVWQTLCCWWGVPPLESQWKDVKQKTSSTNERFGIFKTSTFVRQASSNGAQFEDDFNDFVISLHFLDISWIKNLLWSDFVGMNMSFPLDITLIRNLSLICFDDHERDIRGRPDQDAYLCMVFSIKSYLQKANFPVNFSIAFSNTSMNVCLETSIYDLYLAS